MGSPPRVRERQYDYRFREERFRITPACAGKTVMSADLGTVA